MIWKFEEFYTGKKQNPFACEWYVIVGENKIDDVDFSKVAEIILSKEKQIIETTEPLFDNDGYTGLGTDSLTSRFMRFNVFSWDEPEIQKLKSSVFNKYLEFLQDLNVPRRKVYIQCWANVLRHGQEIKAHSHDCGNNSYLSGHISVQVDNTSTCYYTSTDQLNNPAIYESKNEIGKLTIFQSCVPHYTTKNLSDRERITIAFDLFIYDEYQEPKKHLILFDEGITDGN